MTVKVTITDENGKVLDTIVVTGDTERMHNSSEQLGERVRKHIEERFWFEGEVF